MNKIKFIIFSVFDHTYKLGHKSPDQGIVALFFFQSFSIMIFLLVLEMFLNFSIMSYLVKTRSAPVFAGILYFLNYWYFIKKKGSEKLIEQFESNEINTRKNRMIARIKFFAILILSIIVIVIYTLLFRVNMKW